jgi:hypothetical protein
MQIKSLTNKAVVRIQLAEIQRGLSKLNKLSASKLQQRAQRILGVAKAPQDDQHTVYVTGAGVGGSRTRLHTY